MNHFSIDQNTCACNSFRVGKRATQSSIYDSASHVPLVSPTHTPIPSATAAGEIFSEVRYSAFGEMRFSTNSTPTDYLYTGQRIEEAGLYFYVARFYDAALAHFVQAELAGAGSGEPDGVQPVCVCKLLADHLQRPQRALGVFCWNGWGELWGKSGARPAPSPPPFILSAAPYTGPFWGPSEQTNTTTYSHDWGWGDLDNILTGLQGLFIEPLAELPGICTYPQKMDTKLRGTL